MPCNVQKITLLIVEDEGNVNWLNPMALSFEWNLTLIDNKNIHANIKLGIAKEKHFFPCFFPHNKKITRIPEPVYVI
jgi:hypothetical protein